jgi:type II secretory pathway component PulC
LVGRIVVGLILTSSVLAHAQWNLGQFERPVSKPKSPIAMNPVGAESAAHEHSKDLLSERKAELAQRVKHPLGKKVVLEVQGLE